MATTVEGLVQSIAEWVSDNVYQEINPTPLPNPHVVDATDLLDHISKVTGITKEQIGEWAST